MIKFNSSQWLMLHAVFASVAVSGCAADASAPEESVEELRGNLFRTGTTWANSIVNVCIDPVDNGGADKDRLVAEAQRVLAATWGKASKLQFKGSSETGAGQAQWGTCAYGFIHEGNYSTIALHFCTGSSSSAFCAARDYDNGTKAPGAYRGMVNNGTPYYFGPVPPTMFTEPYDVTYRPGITPMGLVGDDTEAFQTRFRYQVIHEFGHALGFRHEQDREDNSGGVFCDPDTTTTTDISTVDFDYGVPYGVVDNNSIMSYCARDTLASVNTRFPVLLSGIDIWGARQVYGTRPSAHGFMILSDGDPTLAVNAYGGATDGGILRMNRACTITNPDCTWTYQRGMLVSDKDPTLAIKRVRTSDNKWILRLARAALRVNPSEPGTCTPSNGECTWSYKLGQFELDADRSYRLNARGGANDLAEVGVSPACTTANNSCMWTMPNVMLTSDRDSTLPINAFGGASDKKALKVNQACDTTNGSCTFTFSRGMIKATGNTALAWNAYGGASDGAAIKINSSCRDSNKSCTWEWTKGRLKSDDETNGKFYVNAFNGAIDLHDVLVKASCAANNPDCVFSGFSAKN
jgi:hypothetical protein